MFQVLNVAIGVTFVFLLFSLIISAMNELWLSFMDKRAAFLKQGLRELLQDETPPGEPAAAESIATDHLLQHGLIAALSRKRYKPATTGTEGVPSYIPGKSFVLALLSLIEQRNPPGTALQAQIVSLPNTRLRESLLALYADAEQDLTHFKANIENWFNESMDRVGGWYKRHAQQWLFGLGFATAIICNVDAIRIVTALSTDPKLREGVAELAITHVRDAAEKALAGREGSTPANASPGNADIRGTTDNVTPTPATGTTTSTPATSPAAPSPPSRPALNEGVQNVQTALTDLGATGVPIGWSRASLGHLIPYSGAGEPASLWQFLGRWFAALAGWLMTALAASLGAPFWFDLLNRFVDLRGVGRAPEEKDPTAPKKKATEVESYLTTRAADKEEGAQPNQPRSN
jgi:hypothetical protein